MKSRIEELEAENEFCEALNVKVKNENDQLKIDKDKLLCERQLMIDALDRIYNLEPLENLLDFLSMKLAGEALDIVRPVEGARE